MDQITSMFEVDIVSWILVGFVIMFGIVAIATVIGKLLQIVGKPLKWVKRNDKDHEILDSATRDVDGVKNDVKKVADEYAEIKSEINKACGLYGDLGKRMDSFITTMEGNVSGISLQIAELTQKHKVDYEKLTDSYMQMSATVQKLTDSDSSINAQIDNLRSGMIELLGDRIDERFSEYISLDGIPEDTLSEFVGIFNAYEQLGGNHKRRDKYDYIINHIKVLPVESHIVQKDND